VALGLQIQGTERSGIGSRIQLLFSLTYIAESNGTPKEHDTFVIKSDVRSSTSNNISTNVYILHNYNPKCLRISFYHTYQTQHYNVFLG
jgi:hypothetical protein